MPSEAIAEFLATFARFGIHLGLDTSRALLAQLGNPEQATPILHVAGTNGKGSTCAMAAAILQAAGYRVGLYTSPHLVRWEERVQINGEPIAAERLWAALQQVHRAIPPGQQPTQFEVFTAALWLILAEAAVDIAVIEVGLGGRLDATNVVATPLACGITSIGRDHWQRLGDTLPAIAGEKAGILKPACPAFASALIPATAQTVIAAQAQAVGAPLTWVPPHVPYPLALPGEHQKNNGAIAVALVQSLRDRGWPLPEGAIAQGLQHTRWRGRLQTIVLAGRKILLDGAHNLDGIHQLRAYIDAQYPQTPCHWIVGILCTKDGEAMVQALPRPGDRLWPVTIPGHDGFTAQELRAWVPVGTSVGQGGSWPEALLQISPDEPTIVCGSLYLIGDVLGQMGR
ncbi:MAG TPA: bifunctional folylpolyglutamate synthase/dihydrofolate synthase [Cyanobacteria bacterium UBA8156]|jgi:dihydrofolate synthase/folylpolyglutamate synthase|nr:bifunctional folylpolyglutamate synthase/dihydrofolate synthase [Cyanobacteria bacterium UBA8156]